MFKVNDPLLPAVAATITKSPEVVVKDAVVAVAVVAAMLADAPTGVAWLTFTRKTLEKAGGWPGVVDHTGAKEPLLAELIPLSLRIKAAV